MSQFLQKLCRRADANRLEYLTTAELVTGGLLALVLMRWLSY